MSIVKVLPGDLADRQSILELKLSHAADNIEFSKDQPAPRGKNMLDLTRSIATKSTALSAAFGDELILVQNELVKKWIPDLVRMNKVEAYDKLHAELSETNATLWEFEDKIRDLEKAPTNVQQTYTWLYQVRDTAFTITHSNDKRSELIKAINALWGYDVQEKMY